MNDFEAIWAYAIRHLTANNANDLHGTVHWRQVERHGRALAAENGANEDIVRLFAIFHDSQRCGDGNDPEHGKRAADYLKTIRGHVFELSDDDFELLLDACEHHTTGRYHDNISVATCWDADRLDLGRVGLRPDPQRSIAQAAKKRLNSQTLTVETPIKSTVNH